MILGDSEASFVPYDKDLEPLATQEEAAAYEANMALEAEREQYSCSKGALRGKETSEHGRYILNCCFIFRFISSASLYFALDSLVSGFDCVASNACDTS